MTDTATTERKKHLPLWLHETLELMGGAIGYETIKSLVKSFVDKTGEKVTEHAAEWIGVRLGGVKAEDERQFVSARILLDPNDRTRLSKRLDALTPEMNDWYRVIRIQDTPEKTAAVLLADARMSDTDWQREVRIMNLNQHKAEATFDKFMNWLRTDGAAILQKATTAINNDTTRIRAVRTAVADRNATHPDSFGGYLLWLVNPLRSVRWNWKKVLIALVVVAVVVIIIVVAYKHA